MFRSCTSVLGLTLVVFLATSNATQGTLNPQVAPTAPAVDNQQQQALRQVQQQLLAQAQARQQQDQQRLAAAAPPATSLLQTTASQQATQKVAGCGGGGPCNGRQVDPPSGFAQEQAQLLAAMAEVTKDIDVQSAQVKEESQWLLSVGKILEEYATKVKRVKANVDALKGSIKKLNKRKDQIQNLMLQGQLKQRLDSARSDLANVNEALETVSSKHRDFKQSKGKLNKTIELISQQLKHLRGEGPAPKLPNGQQAPSFVPSGPSGVSPEQAEQLTSVLSANEPASASTVVAGVAANPDMPSALAQSTTDAAAAGPAGALSGLSDAPTTVSTGTAAADFKHIDDLIAQAQSHIAKNDARAAKLSSSPELDAKEEKVLEKLDAAEAKGESEKAAAK